MAYKVVQVSEALNRLTGYWPSYYNLGIPLVYTGLIKVKLLLFSANTQTISKCFVDLL